MQVTQSCATLYNPMDCSSPGSSVHGMLQARTLVSGLPFPPPGDLPDPGMKPRSLMSPALASGFFTTRATWEALISVWLVLFLGMTTSPETKFTTQK